jgi:hypothetical protein
MAGHDPVRGGIDAPTTGRSDGDEPPAWDLSAQDLDDRDDREELRRRYYGLLQELRVILPGVQVLVAFLLTVPFDSRFEELDGLGRFLFGVAITSGMLAIVAFMVPTAHHRLGRRTDRGNRLAASIVATRVGLGLLAVALVASLTLVARFVYGAPVAAVLASVMTASILAAWIVLPHAQQPDNGDHRDPA